MGFRYHLCTIIVSCATIASCSSISHIPKDELLYTGTRSIEVEESTPSALLSQAVSEAKVAFAAPPNNALLGSSRYRTPFPIGLWAYNTFADDSTGWRHWLYKTFATPPIYISMVNPKLRTEVATNTLHNYGYLDADASYRIDTLAGGRKAKLSYTLRPGKPWRYGKVEYRGFETIMDSLIHSTWSQRLLREGEQMSYATLSGERSRLFTLFRNHGFYYFQPEMITLLVDTSYVEGEAQVRLTPQTDITRAAITPWHVGHTYLSLNKPHTTRQAIHQDTLTKDFITYTYEGNRIPIHERLLASRIAYNVGDLYSSNAQDMTLRELYQMGIFNSVSINYAPRDHTDTLDVHINTMLELPYEYTLEANLTTKNNGLVGPSIVTSLSRKNLLRMAEVIKLSLKGAYEWQTDRVLRNRGSDNNSFEVGADLVLSIPQLLSPIGKDNDYTRPVSTTARIYGDWLHRGGYFRILALGGNVTYSFGSTDCMTHSLTPFALTFNTLEHSTARFDSIMSANPAIGLSFRNQFIPAASYSFTYDNTSYNSRSPSRVILSLTSAGVVTTLLFAATGHPWGEKDKSLWGTPYAQFAKATIEACRYYNITPRHTLATRLILGGIYAYGNSSTSPFREQFHMGGSDDLRAFPLRSIGPGSYHTTGRYGYVDHAGDLKFEANIEWRFPLLGELSGALFVDAGNVWLLRDDASRPGGQFQWHTFPLEVALGTGFGFRYDLKLLLLRCDVGIPLHIPYPTERTGYYNIPHFTRSLCLHLGVGFPF